MDNESFYDTEIAPVLNGLAKRCNDRGMAFLATVEYKPKEHGTTAILPDGAGLAMAMLYLCARSGGNVDPVRGPTPISTYSTNNKYILNQQGD